MNALPLEIITFIASSIIGTASKLIALFISAKREEKTMQMQLMAAQGKLIDSARRYENPIFQWTRRTIALGCVFFVIIFPKLVAVFAPSIPVIIGYSEIQHGFLFSSTAKTVWQSSYGLVITPLDTHMLAAITGLYFGGSLAQH